MNNAIKELSWRPVRRGPYYCAPACGARCTIVQFDKAGFDAKQLAERLGEGWHPHVWENMGWYSSAIDASGCWKVHVHHYEDGPRYTAYLGTADSPGGKWADSASTPETAIRKAQTKARAELRQLQQMLDAAGVSY